MLGCVLSIDPKVEELYRVIEKDADNLKESSRSLRNENNEEYNDFEEGYSDDDIFMENDSETGEIVQEKKYFKSWILDKCFINLGWAFKGNEVVVIY